ncbi:MAG: AAA family ATPase [bacterium]
MRLKSIELSGFKSFAKKTELEFASAITSIVGPNGSGKSNIAESFRFALGEQSMKSMRGRRGEDMIWNGSQNSPRAGRASVKLIFDNADRALALDFDEVVIERVVNRDGTNQYLLNSSEVRLRDVAELLAQANIGSSSHHIISQGEADRALSASPRERREMLEDALGLTSFLYKRQEAKRKLEKTAENSQKVESLRRELAPHLRFLAGQVKKIEDSQKLRDDLGQKYLEYLKRESVYLRIQKSLAKEERDAPEKEHALLNQTIAHLRSVLEKKREDSETNELMRLESEMHGAAGRRDALVRELGRIEGELAAEARMVPVPSKEASVPSGEVRTFVERVEQELDAALKGSESEIKNTLLGLVVFAQEFLRRIATRGEIAHKPAVSHEELLEKKTRLENELQEIQKKEGSLRAEVSVLRLQIEGEKDENRSAERELFVAMSRRSELEVALARLEARAQALVEDEARFKAECGEAAALMGRAVMEYENTVLYAQSGDMVTDADMVDEDRTVQGERRRKLERQKIRLEEAGLGSASEILKEHQETLERDQFLARELNDLAASAESLNGLIDELTGTLEARFVGGIEKINVAFNSFFQVMFGGGSASLALVAEKKKTRGAKSAALDTEDGGYFEVKGEGDKGGSEENGDEEDEDKEEGVEITVSLPHKRLKGLHALSGGERALTSIALIFAMSQVNPPPFLILDETDAALDEANSRRYGDMIETLARHSQLILITHNRETMSRAGVLYGVTMGSDGVSKLLSVKFEEALAVAK